MTTQITETIDDDSIRAAVAAVEENNDINDGSWKDWFDASHVAETYDITLGDAEAVIIDRAIESNGASLQTDLPEVECAVWGQNFHGSFFDRA